MLVSGTVDHFFKWIEKFLQILAIQDSIAFSHRRVEPGAHRSVANDQPSPGDI